MAAKHNHHKAQSWRTARGKGATGGRDREEGGGGSKSEEEEERPANTAEVRSELKGLLFKPAKPQTPLNTNHALFMCSCVHPVGHNQAALYFTAQ